MIESLLRQGFFQAISNYRAKNEDEVIGLRTFSNLFSIFPAKSKSISKHQVVEEVFIGRTCYSFVRLIRGGYDILSEKEKADMVMHSPLVVYFLLHHMGIFLWVDEINQDERFLKLLEIIGLFEENTVIFTYFES